MPFSFTFSEGTLTQFDLSLPVGGSQWSLVAASWAGEGGTLQLFLSALLPPPLPPRGHVPSPHSGRSPVSPAPAPVLLLSCLLWGKTPSGGSHRVGLLLNSWRGGMEEGGGHTLCFPCLVSLSPCAVEGKSGNSQICSSSLTGWEEAERRLVHTIVGFLWVVSIQWTNWKPASWALDCPSWQRDSSANAVSRFLPFSLN